MASYTDAISQFNPYVQQLPVELMMKVGMHKQAQYDQGVQKIQQSIDNVAGLDVYNPVSKKYLESKLNELNGRLRSVAAGDFSNQQLVNSVSGMASQIIKDPNIQNAVYSAAQVRKQSDILQAAKTKGESSPENEDLFNEQLSKYYNSTDVRDKFTGEYVPYIDMYKDFSDFAEKFGYDKKTTQQLWNQREDGSYILDKNGNRTWNNIMLTSTIKQKDAEKMLNAYQASLTPKKLQQLAITGRYVNKNKTQEELVKDIESNYSEQKNFAETNLEKVKLALYDEESKNKKDLEKIQGLADQYKYYADTLTKIEKATESQIEDLKTNPESTKINLYTNKWLHNVSKGLADAAGKEIEYKNEVNPMFTVTMELNKFNEDKRHHQVDEKLSAERIKVDKENAAFDRDYKKAELYYKYGVGTPPAGMAPKVLKEPLDPEEDGGQSLVTAVDTQYNDSITRLNQINLALTTEWVKAGNPRKANESEEQWNSRVAGIIRKVAGTSETDPNSGNINDFTSRFATKQLTQWRTKKNAPAEFRDLLIEQDNLIKDISHKKSQMDSAESEAILKAEARGLSAISKEEIRKKVKPLVLKLPDNSVINLSKDDVIDIVHANPEQFNTFGARKLGYLFGNVTVDKEQERLKTQALNRLRLKYGSNLNTILTFIQSQPGAEVKDFSDLASQVFSFGARKTMLWQRSASYHPVIEEAASMVNDERYRTRTKLLGEVYKERGMVKQPISVAVQRGKENKEDVNGRLSSIVDKFRDVISNEADVQSAILEEGSAVKFKVHPELGGGIKYEMVVTSKKGTKYTVPVDEESYSYMMGQPFSNVPTPKIVEQINSYGSSNLTQGSNNPSTAWFSANDFTNISNNNYTVTGDLITDKANKNKLWFKMYLHHKDGSIEPLTYPKAFMKFNPDGTINQDLDYLSQGINESVIEQIKNK